MLVAVAVNGGPTFVVVNVATFDASGAWTLGAVVPPGLAGIVVDFQEFGFAPDGKVAASNRATVEFS